VSYKQKKKRGTVAEMLVEEGDEAQKNKAKQRPRLDVSVLL
jgi:hypothetical protein